MLNVEFWYFKYHKLFYFNIKPRECYKCPITINLNGYWDTLEWNLGAVKSPDQNWFCGFWEWPSWQGQHLNQMIRLAPFQMIWLVNINQDSGIVRMGHWKSQWFFRWTVKEQINHVTWLLISKSKQQVNKYWFFWKWCNFRHLANLIRILPNGESSDFDSRYNISLW